MILKEQKVGKETKHKMENIIQENMNEKWKLH